MTNNTNYNPQKWKDLNFKDKASYCTALVSFVLGFILLFIGFFISPAGEIDPSVITAWGTALVYTASVFSISLFIKNSHSEMRAELMNNVNQAIEDRFRRKELERVQGEVSTEPKMDEVFN